MRIYYIEHQTAPGWTPEGQAALFARLAAKEILCAGNQSLCFSRSMYASDFY